MNKSETNLTPVTPIYTVELFPELSSELLAVLRNLSQEEWEKPTACEGWSVKDIAAHLLGGNIGRLSSGRDRRSKPGAPAPQDFDDLVDRINQANAGWVQNARWFSPQLLIDFIALTDPQLYQYFKTLPPDAPAGISVAWEGELVSPNWFDIAREYTEKWLHQQHIREAVGKPVLTGRRLFYPVLDTFIRALPRTYRHLDARDGIRKSIHILGDAGGEWSLLQDNRTWVLLAGSEPGASSTVRLDQDLAWRLFTKGVSRAAAQARIQIDGDQAMGSALLDTVSIMA